MFALVLFFSALVCLLLLLPLNQLHCGSLWLQISCDKFVNGMEGASSEPGAEAGTTAALPQRQRRACLRTPIWYFEICHYRGT